MQSQESREVYSLKAESLKEIQKQKGWGKMTELSIYLPHPDYLMQQP